MRPEERDAAYLWDMREARKILSSGPKVSVTSSFVVMKCSTQRLNASWKFLEKQQGEFRRKCKRLIHRPLERNKRGSSDLGT